MSYMFFAGAVFIMTAGSCGGQQPMEIKEATEIFWDDFDGNQRNFSTVSVTYSGVKSLEDVQGLSAAGFKGKFLRNSSPGNPAAPTTVILRGLPKHEAITIGFLLALIDSWDGTYGPERTAAGGAPNSTHAPDYFNVTIDGVSVFKETFFFRSAKAQTYDESHGTLLSRDVDLGFNTLWKNSRNTPPIVPSDLAYDMNREPAFRDIPHTGNTLTISLFSSGSGWQGLGDESWGIDNLRIVVKPVTSRVPTVP